MAAEKTLYERAVELAKQRASVSITNLKSALNCTDAQAKSFLRIMREEGVLGAPMANLGRYPVLTFEGEPPAEANAVINFDSPELTVIYGRDVPIDEILDKDSQDRLRKIMDELVLLESQQAAINDQRRLVMEIAKATRFAPKVLKKLASALYRGKKQELLNGMDLTRLYLHGLGELIEDEVPPAPDLQGGGNGTRH